MSRRLTESASVVLFGGWFLAVSMLIGCSSAELQAGSPDPRRPRQAVKLVFIHHSCGENWLADAHGGLARALAENNYFVSDTNYGWGPDGIGDRTDITDWPEWFTGPRSGQYLHALYRESDRHCEYTRTAPDPGGENRIVVFKSCFPNSNLEGSPTDGPARGEGLTVSNAKAIYDELLRYFAARPDKLFVVVTAPPVQDRTYAANARAFNTWLVRDWLARYRGKNVAVFDFYNVLTAPGNHHRFRNGRIDYTREMGADTLSYPTNGDDHPSPTGNRKATAEFVPLLNVFYNEWAATAPATATASGRTAEAPPRPATVETPPKLAPAQDAKTASHAPVEGLIDDFERESRAWTVFRDGEAGTRLTFRRDDEIRHGGTASLHIEYDVAPGGWATCSLVYDRPCDWRGFQGVSMHIRAERLGQPITVVVYGGESPDDLRHFEYRFTADRSAIGQWLQVEIPWQKLRLPEWQGDRTERFDPGSAMGVALAFQSAEDGRRAGELWIDDIRLCPRQGR